MQQKQKSPTIMIMGITENPSREPDPEISIRGQRAHESIRADHEISITAQRAHEANRIRRRILSNDRNCDKDPEKPEAKKLKSSIQNQNEVQQSERINVERDPFRYYEMDAKPRGICLIINNRNFSKDPVKPEAKALPKREITDVDAAQLRETFKNLDFIIEHKENLPDTAMVKVVNQLAAFDHSDYDCVACCILSHGTEGAIYGCNGCLVKIRDLTEPFRPQSCPTLSGKPKLFFIQACQGEEKQKDAAWIDSGIDTGSLKAETIPNEADFLLRYSTVPEFGSSRSKIVGTRHETKLTKMLKEHANKEDILSVLMLVNYEVCKEDEHRQYKQPAAVFSSLRKKLIFK